MLSDLPTSVLYRRFFRQIKLIPFLLIEIFLKKLSLDCLWTKNVAFFWRIGSFIFFRWIFLSQVQDHE